ncbi:MAG: ATP-binding protein [Legionellales bacterium]|nr:ATP-binding protein [Legionellales bacterium]
MLIDFKITNYRSIKSPQTLSLLGGSGAELPQNLYEATIDGTKTIRLVQSTVIYGANAAGKSNIVGGLNFMRGFIVYSSKESQQGDEIPIEPFLFDHDNKEQPTELEITFTIGKTRYVYGFVIDRFRVYEEWLYTYPAGRIQKLFSRQYDKEKESYDWKFSPKFKGEKNSWKAQTRDNALFLSTAVQLNCEQLKPVFDYFKKDIIVISARETHISPMDSFLYSKTVEGKKELLKFLQLADATIQDFSIETETFSVDHPPFNILSEEIKDNLTNKHSGKEVIKKITLFHGDIALEMTEESDGTNKLFALAGLWCDVFLHGQVLVIDELNNSLHPILIKHLVELFSNPNINKHGAQLIFTTHDTSLLDAEIFRRDQIWFVEKDKNNATQLYPLLDFSPRKAEVIGKGYLQGRYGALPYIGNWGF